MLKYFPRIARPCFAMALCLLLSGCGLINGLLGTAMSLAPAAAAKMAYQCVPEGVHIDTVSGSQTIESLKPGDLVIGYGGEPVRILQKHEYLETGEGDRFRRIEFECGAEVRVCDMHRIGGIRSKEVEVGLEINGHTVKSISAFGDVSRSYDLLTEDDGYRIEGIPVNSMIEELSVEISRNVRQQDFWKGRTSDR